MPAGLLGLPKEACQKGPVALAGAIVIVAAADLHWELLVTVTIGAMALVHACLVKTLSFFCCISVLKVIVGLMQIIIAASGFRSETLSAA